MPNLTLHTTLSLLARNEFVATISPPASPKPAISNKKADTIAGVTIAVVIFVCFYIWLYTKYREYQIEQERKCKVARDMRGMWGGSDGSSSWKRARKTVKIGGRRRFVDVEDGIGVSEQGPPGTAASASTSASGISGTSAVSASTANSQTPLLPVPREGKNGEGIELVEMPKRVYVGLGRESSSEDEYDGSNSGLFRDSRRTVGTIGSFIEAGVGVPVALPDREGSVEVEGKGKGKARVIKRSQCVGGR